MQQDANQRPGRFEYAVQGHDEGFHDGRILEQLENTLNQHLEHSSARADARARAHSSAYTGPATAQPAADTANGRTDPPRLHLNPVQSPRYIGDIKIGFKTNRALCHAIILSVSP